MSSTEYATSDIQRTFYELPEEEEYDVERLEFLSSFAGNRGLPWATLLESERILIVSEAGVGKTYESQREQHRLWDEGQSAFFIELAVLATDPLEAQFDGEQKRRFHSWLSAQSEHATFFLDSVDELKLTQRSFEVTIKRFANAIEGHLGRARIVITTRPVAVDRDVIRRLLPVPPAVPTDDFDAETYFANVAMRIEPEDDQQATPKALQWRHVALAPLDHVQMRVLAKAQDVPDPEPLLNAIDQQHAHDFAKRPLDFIELCGDWKAYGRIRTHREQVSNNVDVKLRARTDRSERVDLTHDKAREGAERLALAALLTRRFTIWYSLDSDRGSGDSALDPSKVLTDWTLSEISTLLERPMFGFATYGRVRFHSRSVVEFLAAERLQKLISKGMSPRTLKRLLFSATPVGISLVKPTMQPVAAWLAAGNSGVRADVLKLEPSILLRLADPASLDVTMRSEALRVYVETYGKGGWRGLHVPELQIQRLASEDLGSTIQDLWSKGIENPEVRETLLELIAAGKVASGADIAYNAAIDTTTGDRCRLEALVALAAIDDPRWTVLLDELATLSDKWPHELASAAMIHLFPDSISVSQLLKVLGRLRSSDGEIGGTASHLPSLISRSSLPVAQLESLMHGLMILLDPGVSWSEQLHHAQASRQDLILALLVVCNLLLSQDRNVGQSFFGSVALALALSDRDYRSGHEASALRAALAQSEPSTRACVFWATDRLYMRLRPEKREDAWGRLFAFEHKAPFRMEYGRDRSWVTNAVGDASRPVDERAVVLEVAKQFSRSCPAPLAQLKALLPLVADNTKLHESLNKTIDCIEHPAPEPKWLKEDRARTKESRRKQAKAIASWRMFRRELTSDPDAELSAERAYDTIWNLWRAMSNADDSRQLAGWNRGFLERVLNAELVDRIRIAMCDIWRREKPTLRSEREKEKRDTYLMRWRLGLASLYAEAEDESWTTSINVEEAEKAARHALLQYNGLPTWLDDVIRAHPSTVESLIGSELTAELDDEDEENSWLLQNIAQSSPLVIQLFLNRVRAWVEPLADHSFSGGPPSKYERAVELLLAHGTEKDAAGFRDTAINQLRNQRRHADVVFWLPVLLKLDAAAAVEAMDGLAKDVVPAQTTSVTQWFGDLFAHSSRSGGQDLSALDAKLLLRLARLAYTHVRSEDDTEFSRSSGPRDHAQQARGAIVNALLDSRGVEAWAAKVAFSNDPMVAHFKDRAQAVAKQKLAEEWDAPRFDESDVVRLEANCDFAPLSRADMAALLSDRLEALEDLLAQDVSPREAWRTITAERVLRREIARALQNMARSTYSVAQESVTGDEKETDIRLRSTTSEQEAVIELKVAESGYSANDYKEALEHQLLHKYLAPEQRRAGCLLISISRDRSWQHPVGRHTIGLDGLLEYLNSEAKRLTHTMHGEVFLTVKAMDLRPRLPR